jgi:hypothetical protein
VSAWTGGDPDRAGEFSRLFGHRIWRHAPADIGRWMTAAGLRITPEPRGSHPGVVDARCGRTEYGRLASCRSGRPGGSSSRSEYAGKTRRSKSAPGCQGLLEDLKSEQAVRIAASDRKSEQAVPIKWHHRDGRALAALAGEGAGRRARVIP